MFNYRLLVTRRSLHAWRQLLLEGIGTQVNGDKVSYYGPIRSSDIIAIGNYEFRVGEATGEDLQETPPAAGEQEDLTEKDWTVETVVGMAIKADTPEQKEESLGKQRLYLWRNRIHQDVLRMMDLRRTDVGSMDEDELRMRVEEMIAEVMLTLASQIPDDIDHEQLKTEVLNEAVGLGPLEELLANDDVTEIMVNAYDDIYIEQSGRLTKSHVSFSSDNAVMSAIERIVSPLGRRIDESSPMVDARLKDGSRVNAIIPPLALRGPCLTIRKFAKT